MGLLAKPLNRVLFLACVLVTGALAGAFVWAFFFCMDIGIEFAWHTLPEVLGAAVSGALPGMRPGRFGVLAWPLVMCVGGGLVIGLYEKHVGFAPEELNSVMARVKSEGRYPYDHLGKRSIAALLPLLFGGSVGPEAGLTGVIAGLCTWVGDRMRRFGSDFRAMTMVGTQAALTAVFTAPLYGFAAPLAGTPDGRATAGAGALAAFVGLGQVFGGGGGLPRFTAANVGAAELAWLVPLALAGTAAGWVFHASGGATQVLACKMGARPVAKSLLAGAILALCGMALPYTMFAGEAQATMLQTAYAAIPAAALIATGFVKAAVTPLCINLGWRGGHFFPVIFSGISLGYGFALVSGVDPVFCVAACTAALMGTVMRQPLMAALLLIMCFPLKGVVVMLAAATIGAAIPLPKVLRVN
ncbi:chloride channel protein [Senegalimassilia faecalis]|uniref:chloride channel protein n=1 Tax=Senegalimassilia faecalis TaxID=2509433 RepID=UPI003A96AC2D